MPIPSQPLSLTDRQLQALMQAAAVLEVRARGAFLETVAHSLRGRAEEIGDGELYQLIAACQRQYVAHGHLVATTGKVGRHSG
jgi:hypothetical protein